MGPIKSVPPPTCFSSQYCSEWARIYLKYCLCSATDAVALFLGFASILSWGIAEVPQIITNYREKSTDGLSVAFLMTWIVGDLFNLIGCLLEPLTLPTQYYVALLYTVTTIILTGQSIYYGHIYHKVKAGKSSVSVKIEMVMQLLIKNSSARFLSTNNLVQEGSSIKESLLRDAKKTSDGGFLANDGSPSKEDDIRSSPIPVSGLNPSDSFDKDYYYMSARSLSKNPVPTFGSWLANARSSRLDGNWQSAANEPFPSGRSAPPKMDAKNMLSVAPSAAVFICICIYHLSIKNAQTASHGMVIPLGRKLLQDQFHDDGSSGAATLLGWAMAAIYLGGRLPQIYLNIRRGNVQGLNPLMFIFALIGNTTYVGSILVKSFDWSTIGPNLPWLVDAGGCALLDAFILLQFVYFHRLDSKKPESKENIA